MIESTGPLAPSRAPRVAVAMPARNTARFVGAAIESVLTQEDVDLQLIVVDDASTDGTADIVSEYVERGVRTVRNREHRGIGYCHNVAIKETDAPLIAHVDADDLIRPGALSKLARAVLEDERVGQAYCDFYPIDELGRVSPSDIDYWTTFFARHRSRPVDHARELVVHGMVVSALRTYRRSVFDVVGLFDEALPWAVDYEMALRVAEHYRFAHVPELLYGRRLHSGGVTQRLRWKPWRYWLMRARLVRRTLGRQGGTLFGRGRLITHGRLLAGLAHVVRSGLRSEPSGP